MSFFIQKNEHIADELMDPKLLMATHPDVYGPRFDAIKDIRDQDNGYLYHGSQWKHVASFVNIPLANSMTTLFDAEFMRDKKKFYAFLDRNREYLAYDRRRNSRPLPNQVTFFDGKEI